jgi:hypothetical protein
MEKKLLSVLEDLQKIPKRLISDVSRGFLEPIYRHFISSKELDAQPRQHLLRGIVKWLNESFPTLSSHPRVLGLFQCPLPKSCENLSVDELCTAIFFGTLVPKDVFVAVDYAESSSF